MVGGEGKNPARGNKGSPVCRKRGRPTPPPADGPSRQMGAWMGRRGNGHSTRAPVFPGGDALPACGNLFSGGGGGGEQGRWESPSAHIPGRASCRGVFFWFFFVRGSGQIFRYSLDGDQAGGGGPWVILGTGSTGGGGRAWIGRGGEIPRLKNSGVPGKKGVLSKKNTHAGAGQDPRFPARGVPWVRFGLFLGGWTKKKKRFPQAVDFPCPRIRRPAKVAFRDWWVESFVWKKTGQAFCSGFRGRGRQVGKKRKKKKKKKKKNQFSGGFSL